MEIFDIISSEKTDKFTQYHNSLKKLCMANDFEFKGSFSEENLAKINNYIERNDIRRDGSRGVLFQVFVELSQNISTNSTVKVENNKTLIGVGTFIILNRNDYFEIITGNPASNKDIEKLITKCKKINSLTKEELRNYKREQLRIETSLSTKGRGNIGLIKIVLLTSNCIDLETKKIDKENSFVIIRQKINKKQTI